VHDTTESSLVDRKRGLFIQVRLVDVIFSCIVNAINASFPSFRPSAEIHRERNLPESFKRVEQRKRDLTKDMKTFRRGEMNECSECIGNECCALRIEPFIGNRRHRAVTSELSAD
jgi:hypothetical protein